MGQKSTRSQMSRMKYLNFGIICLTGPELLARLDLPSEVENHHPGLHPFSSRWKHEEEEPGGVQHAGSRGRIRPAAPHPGQQLPAASPDGRQLQEALHHSRRRQQHLPKQVASGETGADWCGSGHLGVLACEREGQQLMSAIISLFHQWDHHVPAPDLLPGAEGQDSQLAHTGAG